MNSFLKTYLIVSGVFFGVLAFAGLLFWGLTQLVGDNAPIATVIIIVVLLISFAITVSIESER